MPVVPPSGPGTGRQPIANPPIRGRANELNQIGALIGAIAQGHQGVLVIEGPPGIGKSRLLAETLTMADKSGVRTLFGEAFEYQQSVPFFSLFTATLRADPPVGDIEALRRLSSSADVGYWVVHDLQDAIRAAAAQTPLAIVLEDIHWADTGTLLALRSLTGALDTAVLWVVTARTGAGGPPVQDTLAVLRRTNATFVHVSAMSANAVAEMVADAVRANADESLLHLAAKAHGNPFLVMELVGGLLEESRLAVIGGRAAATGQGLPRRLGATMHQRLDLLSDDASQVVRVAAVLSDRFSAGLLAAMLERQPASLMSALAEAVHADLLIEDGDQLRFRHDLLREATRQSLPRSLRRAMERQSATIMLGMGVAPAEVATQLARSAEPGDKEAIDALRQAAHAVSRSDVSAAADLSRRALQLTPIADADHGRVVAETVGFLNRASRYAESEELAIAALSQTASPKDEAEIRLRVPALSRHSAQRREGENRRALGLTEINEVTRVRHLAWLAYNLMWDDKDGQQRAAAEEAASAAESIDDPESTVIAKLTLACFDCADGYARRALGSLEELCVLSRTSDLSVANFLATVYHANVLALMGRLDEAAELFAGGTERARQERNSMMLGVWTTFDGMVHLAAGRLTEARAATASLPPLEGAGVTEFESSRMPVLAEVALRTADRNLLQQTVAYARDAYSEGSSMVRRTAAYVLALAAWHRHDLHDAVRWFGGDIGLFGTPVSPQALDQVILAARVASAAGDAGCRARVLRTAETLRREQPTVPLFDSVARYVCGILERDADALVNAATMLASSSRPLLHASAAEDAGVELILVDRRDEALHQLNTAFDTFTRHGALTDARRVGRALRQLGVKRRIVSQPRAKTGWDSLTDSELKVVHLIAQGATNRAVAAQLNLSLHTVKTHVHNAFIKLDITSRGQLAQLSR